LAWACLASNGRTFDPERTDTIVQVGTVEEWEIVNGGGMMMMDFDHPFHIHTNAFQVVSENDRKPRFLAWRDVNVPMGERVRIRIPFQDFPGRTVYHCHILDHEDLGMMATIEMGGKGT
jgi:FtsP/CotA-like multicopper oxidase with cupredoxin domain